jgi:TrmH family RNA methyltransferase
VRATAGAVFRLPLVPRGEQPGGRVARGARGGQRLPDLHLPPPLTFLLGSEREGLADDLLARSHSVTIGLPGAAESLNVAAAGAIALYELTRR